MRRESLLHLLPLGKFLWLISLFLPMLTKRAPCLPHSAAKTVELAKDRMTSLKISKLITQSIGGKGGDRDLIYHVRSLARRSCRGPCYVNT